MSEKQPMEQNKIEEMVEELEEYFDWEENSEQANEIRQALQTIDQQARSEERERIRKEVGKVENEMLGMDRIEEPNLGDVSAYGTEDTSCNQAIQEYAKKLLQSLNTQEEV